MTSAAVPAEARLAVRVPMAAQLISVSESEVRRMVADGRLARVPHTGSSVVIARTELERFVAEREVAA